MLYCKDFGTIIVHNVIKWVSAKSCCRKITSHWSTGLLFVQTAHEARCATGRGASADGRSIRRDALGKRNVGRPGQPRAHDVFMAGGPHAVEPAWTAAGSGIGPASRREGLGRTPSRILSPGITIVRTPPGLVGKHACRSGIIALRTAAPASAHRRL